MRSHSPSMFAFPPLETWNYQARIIHGPKDMPGWNQQLMMQGDLVIENYTVSSAGYVKDGDRERSASERCNGPKVVYMRSQGYWTEQKKRRVRVMQVGSPQCNPTVMDGHGSSKGEATLFALRDRHTTYDLFMRGTRSLDQSEQHSFPR